MALLGLALPGSRAIGAGGEPVDLLLTIRAAEVCPGTGGHCWPPLTSEKIHQEEDDGSGSITLPARAHTNLYLKVPPGATLALEFTNVGTRLEISAATDSGGARAVYRSPGPGEGTQRADIDLGPFAGEVIRLDFRPDTVPGGDAGPRFTRLRKAVLRATARDQSPVDGAAAAPGASRPNVIIYLIDTVRADHLGCYGYRQPTSPRIDDFAASATLFTRAVAQSSWTLPATASVLTGLTPNHHGAFAEGRGIRPDVVTLAELLAGQGYRTEAFVTNSLGSATFGHGRGFERFHFYREEARRPGLHLSSSALYRRVSRWLARRGSRPFFLYVHATDPHWPYLPPLRYARPFVPHGLATEQEHGFVDEYRRFFMGNPNWGDRPALLTEERVGLLRELYDGEIRLADDFFGRLLDDVARRGLVDRTLIILTSDHGEEFLDHDGVAHGQTLYQEVLHVPLVIRFPGGGGRGGRVDRVVQHVDIMPTVLDALALPAQAGLDGRSLLRPDPLADEEAYSFLSLMGISIEGVSGAGWKTIRNLSDGPAPAFEVYDLDHDPRERENLLDSAPVLLRYGERRLRELGAAPVPGPAVAPQMAEQLRAIGYVKE